MSYEDEEAGLKFLLADSLLDDLFADALDHVCSIAAKRTDRVR